MEWAKYFMIECRWNQDSDNAKSRQYRRQEDTMHTIKEREGWEERSRFYSSALMTVLLVHSAQTEKECKFVFRLNILQRNEMIKRFVAMVTVAWKTTSYREKCVK